MRRTIERAPAPVEWIDTQRRTRAPPQNQKRPIDVNRRGESSERTGSRNSRSRLAFSAASLDEQHLLVRRQRPDVARDQAFERVGHFTDLELRGQERVAEVLGF